MKESFKLNEIYSTNGLYWYKWTVKFAKRKTLLPVENQYLVDITMCCSKCFCTMRHWIQHIFNPHLGRRVFHIPFIWTLNAKLHSISYGNSVPSKTLTDKIQGMFSRQHIWLISRSRKKLYLLCWKEGLNIPNNLWTSIVLLKYNSKYAL